MKKSIHTLFLEVVKEHNIDLNSKYKLERTLCIDKIMDKMDWTGCNPYRTERKMKTIIKYVNMSFDQNNLAVSE
jgi:hypothetical protein